MHRLFSPLANVVRENVPTRRSAASLGAERSFLPRTEQIVACILVNSESACRAELVAVRSDGANCCAVVGELSLSVRLRRLMRRAAAISATLATLAAPCQAVTPDSPEVREVVRRGLAFLEKENDVRLGGKALVALAFHKAGEPHTHPRIQEAIEACRLHFGEVGADNEIYSKAIALIFLTEIGEDELAGRYAGLLKAHQKEHGGFSYISYMTGDTSQTQYAALSFWHMLNHGKSPDAESVQRCLKWVIRTQDPAGLWAYQGKDPGEGAGLVEQIDRPGKSMTVAALGAALIMGNALGILQPGGAEAVEEKASDLPAALRLAEAERKKAQPTLPAGDVDRQKLLACLERGGKWFDANFTVEHGEFQSYYLYSLERYRSFEEYVNAVTEEEPSWYQEGFEFLKQKQAGDGSWNDQAGKPCATAFSVLFLLRSTQQSIKASLGQGTLVGGRGLPRDLSKVRLKGGRLVVESKPTEVDQLLGMLDDTDSDALDALLDDPAALRVDDVSPKDARRLQQVVRSGGPEARVLAVRALARMRDLDYVPTLLFAMTDPDRRVVREARDGLRFVSRKFEGFGLSDNFEEEERAQVLDKWKQWYRTVRPDAPPLP